jgi:hypothetical protein
MKFVITHEPLLYPNNALVMTIFPEKKTNIPLGKNTTSTKSIVANFTVAHVIIRWETHSGSMSLHQPPLLWSTLILSHKRVMSIVYLQTKL